MASIWCSEKDCYYNRDCKCKARDVMVYDGECITNRYDKPDKHQAASRDLRDVRMDRNAKHVADKIKQDLLSRMEGATKK